MASSIISWKITYQHNNRLVIEINLENTLEEKPESVFGDSRTIPGRREISGSIKEEL
jgi:hypothetical protein